MIAETQSKRALKHAELQRIEHRLAAVLIELWKLKAEHQQLTERRNELNRMRQMRAQGRTKRQRDPAAWRNYMRGYMRRRRKAKEAATRRSESPPAPGAALTSGA
jgi:hypothetical protein